MAANWINRSFSQDFRDIGKGDYFAFIGTDYAYAVSGGLNWWKWFIGEGGVRVPLSWYRQRIGLRPRAQKPTRSPASRTSP